MPPFDPSVIGSIGDNVPDVAGSIGKALNIKEAIDKTQMNKLALNEAKQGASDDAIMREVLKTSDYTTPEGVMKTGQTLREKGVSSDKVLKFLGSAQKYQSGEIQNQLDRLTLADTQHDVIVGMMDPIVAGARNIKNAGGSDLDANAFIASKWPDFISGVKNAKGPDGKPLIPAQIADQIIAHASAT